MLEGHAAKWVRAVSGATVSPSKVKIALRSDNDEAQATTAATAPAAREESPPSEGERAIFSFIKADEIRDCRDANMRFCPSTRS